MNELKIRVIPIIGLFFSIYIFFISLSTNFYPEKYFLYALVGALAISFCLYYSIKGIQDNEDFMNSIPKRLKSSSNPRLIIVVISCISFIICTISLTSIYSNIKENELKAFGKITKGEIIDGFSLTGQRVVGKYKVTVEYRNDEGNSIKAITEVSPNEFNNYYVGKEVNVIYSSKNNYLVDLLTDNEKVKNYTKIDNKDINIEILLKALDIKQSDLGTYLNKISYSWEFDSTKKCWINNQKGVMILINEDNSLSYLTSFTNPNDLNDEIDLLKLKKIDNSNSKAMSEGDKIKSRYMSADGLYENGKFGLLIKTLPIGQDGRLGTIINVFKK